MGLGLHHNGMHDFILDEMELGTRAALFMDDENNCERLYTLSMEVEMWNSPVVEDAVENWHDPIRD